MWNRFRPCQQVGALSGFLAALLLAAMPSARAVDVIETIIGTGTPGISGDGGPGTQAQVSAVYGLTTDPSGRLVLIDIGGANVRRYDYSTGIISTIAGTGTAGFSGDDGQATLAQFNAPVAGIYDATGNLYIVDQANDKIRRIDTGGIITTVAGSTRGFTDGPALSAQFFAPSGIDIDINGSFIISDVNNNRLRSFNFGQVNTHAGMGSFGFSGDNGPPIMAQLAFPSAVRRHPITNEIYFMDTANGRIRKLDTTNSTITTVYGAGEGFGGDGGPATAALFQFRSGLSIASEMVFDPTGVLYVSDGFNHRIRRIGLDGIITTIAGTGAAGYNGDLIDAKTASVNTATGLAIDPQGNLIIADLGQARVRRVVFNGTLPTGLAISATPTTAKTGDPITFSVTGAPAGTQVTWDFGDGSARQTGNPITHTYTTSFDRTYTAIASLGGLTTDVNVVVPLAPGVANIGNGSASNNPLDGLTVTVDKSEGGIVELTVDASSLIREDELLQTDFTDLPGRGTSEFGARAVHKFTKNGLFTGTTTAKDRVTGVSKGRARKMLAISAREVGISGALPAPPNKAIQVDSLKGKFLFTKETPDQVTFTGQFLLPAGMNILSDTQELSIGIGNVIETVTVNGKGKADLTGAPRIKKLAVKFPKLKKGVTLTQGSEKAKLTVTMSTANLEAAGFDTEGIAASVRTDEQGAKSVKRTIQVAVVINGVAYEAAASVDYKLSKKADTGQLTGRGTSIF